MAQGTLALLMRGPGLVLGFSLGSGLLAGCAPDPFAAPPSWTFTGANGANLAGMVADPMDLVRGQAAGGGASGQLAAAAVTRLRRDQLKPLTSVDTTAGQAGGNGNGTPGGPATAAAQESP